MQSDDELDDEVDSSKNTVSSDNILKRRSMVVVLCRRTMFGCCYHASVAGEYSTAPFL